MSHECVKISTLHFKEWILTRTLYFIFSKQWMMKRQLLEFLQSTSLKGAPRIFRTKSYFLRTLWTISVISFLAMAIHQAISLVVEYNSFPLVVSINKRNLELGTAGSRDGRLPDITFCNMNPFAVNIHECTDIPSLKSYNQRVQELTECRNCSQELKTISLEIRQALQTTTGYYAHIGRKYAERLSHKKENFMASCTIEILSGMNIRRVPCESITTIDHYMDFMYYNCYTLKTPLTARTGIIWGVIMVLHLDNHPDILEQQKYFVSHHTPGQMGGALMAFHQHAQDPALMFDGINLSSGLYMTTKLRFLQTYQMSVSYSTCQNVDEAKGYNEIECYTNCFQRHVYNECGCVEYTHFNTSFDEYVPPCLSVNQDQDWLYGKWVCVQEIHMQTSTQNYCQELCPTPCEELTYEYDVSYCQCYVCLYLYHRNMSCFHLWFHNLLRWNAPIIFWFSFNAYPEI